MAEFSASTLMLDVGLISILMVIGTIMRNHIRLVFQQLLLPAPVTAGLLGLLLGPNVLGVMGFSEHIGSYTTVLIAMVFASMAYSMQMSGSVRAGARRMWAFSTVMFLGQWGIFILIGLYVLSPIFDTPNWFGMMLPVGFIGGFGTAAAVGGALEGIGAAEASSLGFTAATVGTVAAIVGGIIAGNWGIRRGKVSHVPGELPEELRRGYIKNVGERPSLGKATTNPSSIEPLTLHLGFIVLTVAVAYMVNALIKSQFENVSVPLFAMSLVIGLIFRAILNAVGAEDFLDKETMSAVSGASTDYLIAFGIAAIVPSAVASYWVPLLILFVLGIIYCSFFLLYFPAVIFGERWIERGIFGWGWATATVATGIAVLKVVDPKLESGTLSEYGVAYVGFGPFEIGMTVLAPIAVIAGFTTGLGWVATILAIGIFLLGKFSGWYPERGNIFGRGISSVGSGSSS